MQSGPNKYKHKVAQTEPQARQMFCLHYRYTGIPLQTFLSKFVSRPCDAHILMATNLTKRALLGNVTQQAHANSSSGASVRLYRQRQVVVLRETVFHRQHSVD